MKKYEESKANPLHKEYGIWSNTLYIIRKCKQYCPIVIPLALIGILCNSVVSYYWGILGKFIIDLLNNNGTEADKMHSLLIIVLVGCAIAGLLQFGSNISANKTWYRYIKIRMSMITERVDRALGINYEMLERPDVLDVHERAQQATGGNNNGVEGMMHLMETLGTSLVTVIVTFVSVTVLEWKLVIVLIALAFLQYAYHRFCIRTDKKKVWDKLAGSWRQLDYMERVTQDFDYAKDIRIFGLSDFLIDKEQKLFKKRWKLLDFSKNLWFSHAVIFNLVFLIGNGFIYATLLYAVLKKDLSIGNYTLYMSLALAFSRNLLQFLHRFGDYGRASLEVDDFRSFMELDLSEKDETIELPTADSYEIEFHNVSYRYYEAEKDALTNLNLILHAGEKLAVVGLNGAGKTTMIKLLLRLYDPTEGYITLNGVDIRKYDRKDYYKLFSPVFQNIEVLAFPIAEHIAMTTSEETDVDKAYKCAVESGLKEKIDGLPKGISTELLKIVTDEGVDFSGGERQKLALARALYKNAPIVVLDEPTSALDAIAEQNLYESFDSMIGTKSAVYISHRLASTRFCDKIAMFKDGSMIEYGSHDELMEKHGEYANMFEIQAQYYQEQEGEVVYE